MMAVKLTIFTLSRTKVINKVGKNGLKWLNVAIFVLILHNHRR
jgi:hypothetical protein